MTATALVIPVKGLVIPVSGPITIEPIEPTLEVLQALVGGYIESVYLTNHAHGYCNEEGKLDRLPLNPRASKLVEHYHPGFLLNDAIVGDFLVLGTALNGDEDDVPDDVAGFAINTLK